MVLTCYDYFHNFISLCRLFAKLCGADVIDPEYKMNFITWFVIVCINTFFVCTGYTIYVGLVIDGDWKVMLQALCLVGSAVAGYSKLLLCLYRRWVIIDMLDYLYNIYKEYQDKNLKYQTILRECTDFTKNLLKLVSVMYIFAAGVIILYPLGIWFIRGEKMFIMQFLLPGIDPETESGFIMHISSHVCCMVLGAFGNFAGDLLIFIFSIHLPMLKDILKIKLEELNEVVLESHDPSKTMPLLKDALDWHHRYDRFAAQIDEVYYGIILVEVVTCVVGICCTLFSIVIGVWPAAFAYLIYSVILLYSYCGLGHLVEKSNDSVEDIIYTTCAWYELSVPEQKMILVMLCKAQQPVTLTIGGIIPLSMSSALQLTKAIYSYMMMLLNFLETDEM